MASASSAIGKGDQIGDARKVWPYLTFPASPQSTKILDTELAEVFLKQYLATGIKADIHK